MQLYDKDLLSVQEVRELVEKGKSGPGRAGRQKPAGS